MCRRMILLFALIGCAVAVTLLARPTSVAAQGFGSLQYISPTPGARFVPPGTTIAVRQGALIDARTVQSASFVVVGSISGMHPGSVVLASDRKTVIFQPARPFTRGETVQVRLTGRLATASGLAVGDLSFNFSIAANEVPTPEDTLLGLDQQPTGPRAPQATAPPHSPQFVTVPSAFPPLTITVPANGTGEGYLFMSPFPAVITASLYLIILDDSGQPVYYKQEPNTVQDFTKQPNGSLTFYMTSKFYVMDNSYTITDSYQGGNGYTLDMHDFQILPNGDALFLIYNSQTIDMSQFVPGGQVTATVTGCIIQEQAPDKTVVFQWSSWDHFFITDTTISLTDPRIDYVHCNAVELDQDDNLLLSSRHMNEITKIDHDTGDIIWRLNGKNNQFTFVGDSPPYFTYQHDIRRLPNGNITLFDNGDLRPAPLYSRGVEYQMDEVNKVITQTWEFTNTPKTFAFATGNVQRLPNGNTLIDWGTTGLVTELKPDNSKAFEFSLAPRFSYRAFRFPWHGYPTTQPTLVAASPLGRTVLTYSWNGATDIASYRIYKGNAPQPTTLLTTQTKTGFETTTNLPCDPLGTRYYRVMPIDLNGQPTQYSNDVTVGPCIQFFLPFLLK